MNNKYWEEEIETMPREQLRELQLQRLKKTVSIAANSPYYKKVFQEHGITADSIRSIEDIRKKQRNTSKIKTHRFPLQCVFILYGLHNFFTANSHPPNTLSFYL